MNAFVQKKYNIIFIIFTLILYVLQFFLIKETRIDGDTMNIVINEYQQKVLEHKFGVQNIGTDIQYSNSNRYIGFVSERAFFNSFAPIYKLWEDTLPRYEFIYYYVAAYKLLIQWIIALLLSILVAKRHGMILLNLMAVTLFMQHLAWYEQFGIIDHAVSYVFFYAMTMIGHLLLLIILKYKHAQFNFLDALVFLTISWLTVFSGSINYAIHLISLPILFVYTYMERNNLLKITLVLSWFFGVISYLVSLQNIENNEGVNLLSRYALSLRGYLHIISSHIGWLCLITFMSFQIISLRLNLKNPDNRILQSTLVFILIYALLIPLGGYRSYRPLIIRYDVIIPISLAVFGIILYLNQYLLDLKFYRKICLFFGLLLFVFQFIKPYTPNNLEEKSILKEIETSHSTSIFIEEGSQLFAWEGLEKSQESDLKKFLQLLGFINYHQQIQIINK